MGHFFVIKAGKDYEDANSALIETNKILWKMSLCLMLIIFILVIGYLRLQSAVSVTVELPPKIFLSKDLTVRRGLNWADANFYEVWGKYLAEEMTEFKPDNIAKKYAILQKMMRPSLAIKKDEQIQNFVKNVVTNKISQKFTIMQIPSPNEIEPNTFRLVFNGVANIKVGTKDLSPKECNFSVDLKIYDDGVLYVEDFGSNCL
ncbi:MAG: TraE/TraK family type IV conjugative transfer system protein [Sulfurospirillum sp.]